MKFIISLIIFLFPTFIFCQKYLNYTSTWNEVSGYCSGLDCCQTEYSITLTGDTLINGNQYYKTLLKGTETCWNLLDPIKTQTSIEYFGDPIREENNIFYQFSSVFNKEIILNNFNLEIGDTAISNCNKFQIVEKIDTAYLGNEPRRRYFFKDNYVDYLLEGIGNKKGLFTQPCNSIGIEGGSRLICYSQDNQMVQVDTSLACGFITLTKESNNAITDLTIYPNPFENYLYVSFKDEIPQNVQIQLFNLSGILLQEEHLLNPGKLEKIDLQSILSGTYVVVVKSATFINTQKIIKI